MVKDTKRLILKPELLKRIGLSYTTVWNLMRQGLFPRSVIVTNGRVGWHEAEVDKWVATRPRQKLKGDST